MSGSHRPSESLFMLLASKIDHVNCYLVVCVLDLRIKNFVISLSFSL
jgi:hypothetical protein